MTAPMQTGDKLARYPDLPWGEISVGHFLPLLPEDFSDSRSIDDLCHHLFDFPECAVYLYIPHDAPLPQVIRLAEENNDILVPLFERPWYLHRAGTERTFVQIPEASADGVEYAQVTLQLSQARRRAMEIELHIHVSKAHETDGPMILRPALWGIGVDLPKLWRRFKNWRGRR
ncbi:MAG: hypothetical protein HY936_06625 [Nitrosomonadales bacterium]|nr:hypothetical protein [Nitrosomonadales bacterium]